MRNMLTILARATGSPVPFLSPWRRPPGLSGRRRSRETALGPPQPGSANRDNTWPWRQFPAAAPKHTCWERITQNCQSVLEPENCCFKCYSTGKSPLCSCCQKKWQLNLCHTEAALQSHSAWQLSTLHAHIFPLCKCAGEKYTGAIIRTIGRRVRHVSGTKYRWNSISHKIHHPHLICKTHVSPCDCKYSGRLGGNIVMHGVDEGEMCWCQPPGFYVEGRCCGITLWLWKLCQYPWCRPSKLGSVYLFRN